MDSQQQQQFGAMDLSNQNPPSRQKEHTVAWAQEHYFRGDSGCHSGQNTGAPSAMDWDPHGSGPISAPLSGLQSGYETPYTPQQIDETIEHLNQTRSQRVRAAMFPETLDDGTEIPSTQINQDDPTAVQRLTEPSQKLRYAVGNLINYQDDADLAKKAVPELVQLLNDEDQVVANHAAQMVHQLSKKDASRRAIIDSPVMVESLIGAIEQKRSDDTMKHAAGTLHNLSQHPHGLLAIYSSKGVPAICRMLSSPIESVLFYAVTTLHNLLLHQKESRRHVLENSGLQLLVQLLRRDNPKFLTIVIDCLRILTFNSQESKLIVLASRGPSELVRIMDTYDYDKLLYVTCKVLKQLSVCPSNKQTIIDSGGMHVLAKHLQNQRVMQDCLWTLRNLSDAATKVDNLDDLMVYLIRLLDSTDSNAVTCAAGILSNLTCNNPHNKVYVCQIGGIDALVRTCITAGNREEISEPAVCALRHLTSRHEVAEQAQNAVREAGGIPVAGKLLQPPSRWALIKAICGLIRNLAFSPANQAPLRDCDVIRNLVALTVKAFQDCQARRSAMNQQSSQQSSHHHECERMEEVMEGTVGALHILARDANNRAVIRSTNVIRMIVQLLDFKSENLQRVACGLLSELASEREGIEQIQASHPTDKLTRLLHSRVEGTQTYAAAILFKLSADKPAEYRAGLGMELQNSLYATSMQNQAGHQQQQQVNMSSHYDARWPGGMQGMEVVMGRDGIHSGQQMTPPHHYETPMDASHYEPAMDSMDTSAPMYSAIGDQNGNVNNPYGQGVWHATDL